MTAEAVLVVFLLVVAPGVALLAWQAERRQVRRARAFAREVGWEYVGSDPTLVGRWRVHPFGRGRWPSTHEVIRGTFLGRTATSFAYRFTTGGGKQRRTHSFHVVAVDLPAALPTLQLSPDVAVLTAVDTALGGQDIQFESEEFNRRWKVEAVAERFAHDVLHPRLMQRLLEPDAEGLFLRIEGDAVLVCTLGIPRYDELTRRLHVLTAIADAVPRYVWLDHGHDPARTGG
ncbi:DUF3137 domain-containing protein [Cellulomonas sp. APG4]|uniref:DUF3137 domain-containing protein n=1 Tax=Cellulomonas sp. APG4 TaxID=1538656 RepID=UPI00137B4C15|nr:DUF3137 domain-containing protein [Cellulomonas sp. APG4]NCT90343.1 DUF3137 domain-containing protein [Cellulomonas sp. APG4]